MTNVPVPSNCIVTVNGKTLKMTFDGLMQTGKLAFSCKDGRVLIGCGGAGMDMVVDISTEGEIT